MKMDPFHLLLTAALLLLLHVTLAFCPPPSTTSTTSSSSSSSSSSTRIRTSPCLAASSSASSPSSSPQPLVTQQEIDDCAASFGLELRLSTLGPFYRVIARLKGQDDKSEPIGYTDGFVAPPFKLVHLDTMQVRRRYWKQLEGAQKFPYGCGVLLGATAMRHAHDNGCTKAELLAINDDEKTHTVLKKFYRTAGFVTVKEVTNDILCVPDLLVWGGVGTRMDIQVEEFLRRWRPMITSRGNEFNARSGPRAAG